MKSISISHDGSLKLPLDIVTLAVAILAQRGAGKSHLASCLAEEMLDAGQQIVTIDPTGSWFGIKSSADGNKPGYPVVVFGGDHADVPLEEHSGEIIARALVERGFSAIIDLSEFRKGAMRRFMADFLEALYRLNRNPLHVFVDEADAIAPQGATFTAPVLAEVSGYVDVRQGATFTAPALAKSGYVEVQQGATFTAPVLVEVIGSVDVRQSTSHPGFRPQLRLLRELR